MTAPAWTEYVSPIGTLTLTATTSGLCGVRFPDGVEAPAEDLRSPDLLAEAVRQLDEYFAGARPAFDLPLDQAAGTEFQRSVWREVARIPYGATITYGELARRVGLPGHVRAVGGANARNPLPIVVPCHRVIGSRGDLTGYGGGLDRKRVLLDLESARAVVATGRQGRPARPARARGRPRG